MKLSSALAIASTFAGYMDLRKGEFDIDDSVLFGSAAREAKNPNDVDVMLIHHNVALGGLPAFRREDGHQNNFQRFLKLRDLLVSEGYPDLGTLMAAPGIRPALERTILNVVYLDGRFFDEPDYREKVVGSCSDPNFFHNALGEGYIWNSKTEKFDIPVRDKYSIS